MKVLFPIGSFYPSQSGGPSNSVYWHVNGLSDHGVNCIVSTTNSGILENHKIKLSSWEKKRFGLVRYQKTIIHYLPLRAFIAQKSYLNQVDIIHLNNLFYPLSFATAFFVNFFYKKPIVWSIRGELDPDALIYSTWKKKIVLFLIRRLNLSEIYFHSTCDKETEYIKTNFGLETNIIQIPNFILPPNLLGIKKEKILLYLGRIHPKKAIENLIESLSISKKFMISDYKFIVAGENSNEYGSQLKKLAREKGLQEKIEFFGHVEGDRKQNLLSRSYFSFMPSHTENFGNVVVEALAQGTPVVASLGTPWEVLSREKAGFWVSNNSRSLAKTIDRILQMQKEEYDIYQNNAMKLSYSFDVNSQIHRWVNKYLEII